MESLGRHPFFDEVEKDRRVLAEHPLGSLRAEQQANALKPSSRGPDPPSI
jgi:hypothetical protein